MLENKRSMVGRKRAPPSFLKSDIIAPQHNRSAEAEMGTIMDAAVRYEGRLKLGTALSEMSRKIGLANADVEALEKARDAQPAEPMR